MNHNKRYIVILIILLLFAFVSVARLSSMQIINGQANYEKSLSRTQRTIPVTAARGEIYDRYGRVIVANRMGFSIEFQRVKGMDDAEINGIIIKILNILKENNDSAVSDELPITENAPYSFTFGDETGNAELDWKKQFEVPENYNAEETISYFSEQFNVSESDEATKRLVVGVRYSMILRGFGTSTSFTLADDVSQDTVVSIKENYDDYRGVNILTKPIREYPYGNLAAHILGRCGLISDTEYAELKDKGYSLNEQIGKQGLEKLLEDTLKGKSGKLVAQQDEKGHYVAYSTASAAESGNSVFLTIDLDVQMAAEAALKETIGDIYAKSGERKKGADVNGAAAVAVDVSSGDIICMASYPDYSIEDFNKNYPALLADKHNPLFNRAIAGTYSPGSTFKMLVGIAALQENVITPQTQIEDKVIYTLGKSHYKCLKNHGFENVSGAIKDSCNYFFYTVGYNMGIDKIAQYAREFGFGEHTGIELADDEATGTVACPDTKAARKEPWYDGYTVQAAIGQDDNSYTPLQLAAYVSQIASGGVRYTPHLIKNICSYDTETKIKDTEIKEAGRIDISKENLDAVRYGMRLVATDGTAAAYFADYPVEVAAKTGTAEVNGGSDNGIFVAFAPYDQPKIAVAVVIERGGGGAYCGPIVKAIIDAYLNAANDADATVGIDKLY